MFRTLSLIVNNSKNQKKGFTLLELLIVISIIAALSVILIVVLDPAETLKKSRDVQRISDLASLKTAIGIYTASKSSIYLSSSSGNSGCKTGSGSGTYGDSTKKVFYSYPSDSPGASITDSSLDGGSSSAPSPNQVSNTNLPLTDGTGWLPVDLTSLPSGSPISNLPIDPTNTISDISNINSSDLVYRYACNATSLTYEIDARLESVAYTSDDNKHAKDGGNNANLYEVGTNLQILGSGNDF